MCSVLTKADFLYIMGVISKSLCVLSTEVVLGKVAVNQGLCFLTVLLLHIWYLIGSADSTGKQMIYSPMLEFMLVFSSCILLLYLQDELEKSRHELEDMDMEVAQMKAVSSWKIYRK